MGMTGSIDLNADVGEGFGRWTLGDDEGLMAVITSANVACGFHAGDPTIMRSTCASAAAKGVVVGAQVSYRDLAGFGRRFIDVDAAELTDGVLYQLAALEGIARVEGTAVRYVKPHGALYNAIVHHDVQAAAVVAALVAHGGRLPLLGLPGAVVATHASAAGIAFVEEGFADRGYTAEGTLVPRGQPGALLTEPDEVAAQALRLAASGVGSICVHGDTPDAAGLAGAARQAMVAAGYVVAAFA